ncbi:MAG: hypothetical protein HKP61_15570 [Dactylosporangium sp.]|nr:hypothetical protein [Dactylosporangium sp.]NNJ62325.1 hypothetical protein [Dactylosporangium sp.]
MSRKTTRRRATGPPPPLRIRPGNPADDRTFRTALLRQADRLADGIILTTPTGDRHHDHERRHRAAGMWAYLLWAEDHQLTIPLLRRQPAEMTRNTFSSALWLTRAIEQVTAHPSTQWITHPDYNPDLHTGAPTPQAAARLIDWWAHVAPPLAYPTTDDQPTSITGWVIGDLLPLLSADRRTRHALVQTPSWVVDFILDQTLLPAAAEFRTQPLLTVIDPCCGTGHFLIRAVDALWQWYTTGTLTPRTGSNRTPVTGGRIWPANDAIRRVRASVNGVDIDPLTAAVARLRLTVYLAHLMTEAGLLPNPLRLDQIPAWVAPRIGVGDSLLLGQISDAEYAQLHPALARLPGAGYGLADLHDLLGKGSRP